MLTQCGVPMKSQPQFIFLTFFCSRNLAVKQGMEFKQLSAVWRQLECDLLLMDSFFLGSFVRINRKHFSREASAVGKKHQLYCGEKRNGRSEKTRAQGINPATLQMSQTYWQSTRIRGLISTSVLTIARKSGWFLLCDIRLPVCLSVIPHLEMETRFLGSSLNFEQLLFLGKNFFLFSPQKMFSLLCFWHFRMFHTILSTFQILVRICFPPPHPKNKKFSLLLFCYFWMFHAHLLPAGSTSSCG